VLAHDHETAHSRFHGPLGLVEHVERTRGLTVARTIAVRVEVRVQVDRALQSGFARSGIVQRVVRGRASRSCSAFAPGSGRARALLGADGSCAADKEAEHDADAEPGNVYQ
jgi:hypothetical protein